MKNKMRITRKLLDPQGLMRTMSEAQLNHNRSTTKNDDIRRINDDVRRDSSGSNESNGKKQASLNEIQDLYSALQDLVTTNVTSTPLLTRNKNILTSTPDETRESSHSSSRGSPTSFSVSPTSFSVDKQRISSKDEQKSNSFKSGLSGDYVVSGLLKKSPFPNRRLSHDVVPSCEDSKKKTREHTRSSSAASDKIKKDTKLFRKGSNADSKSHKRWKPKLFSRLRSKSNVGLDDCEPKRSPTQISSSEEGGESPEPSSLRGRRSSEADVNRANEAKAARRKNAKHDSCPPVRKRRDISKSVSSLCSENVKDIDQLVAALNLEYSDVKRKPQNQRTSYKSPESELSKLESWFEKAAAEAVMYQSRANLDDDCDSDRKGKDRRTSTEFGNAKSRELSEYENEKVRRKGKSTIKRGTSAGRSRPDKSLFNKVSSNNESSDRLRINSLGRAHARSTPNLRDYITDSPVSSDAESTDLNICDETEKASPRSSRLSKNISFDDNIRLPKTPLFYMPDNKEKNERESNKITINKSLTRQQQEELFESEVFYTSEDKENLTKVQQKSRQKSDSNVQIKQYGSDDFDKVRTNTVFTPGCYIELTIDSSALKTDDNANFCQNGDIGNSNVAEENSIWSRFHNVNDSKEVKAIMA